MKLLRILTILIGSLGLFAPATYAHAATTAASADGGGYPGRGAPHVSSLADQAVAPPAGYPLGIDVSSHDHANGKIINWSTERANGIAFAYVKATEGTSYVNSYFNSDYNTAKSVGIFAGAYAFGRPDLGNPTGQADHFVDNLGWAADGKTLPPFLDMEWPYISGTPMCYGLSTSAMVSWISSFLSRVESRIGRTPMIYTNVNWWNPCTGSSSAFGHYYLDISSCTSSPPSVPGWGTNWTVWQYDIPDCSGTYRDWDVFNGSYTQLAQFAGSGGGGATQFGDVNGDGFDDLISIWSNGDVHAYWYNAGLGRYDGTNTIVAAGFTDPTKVKFGDVNGDGFDDLISIWSNGDVHAYWYNAGLGRYDGTNTIVAGGFAQP